MFLKTELYVLAALILIDLTGYNNLLGENYHRRLLHHFQRNNYNPNLEPWILDLEPLNNKQIRTILELDHQKTSCPSYQIPFLTSLAGAKISPVCSLYRNDFNTTSLESFDLIGLEIAQDIQKKTSWNISLADSDFRGSIIKYEGSMSSFGLHYDTEAYNNFRVLYLIKKVGQIPKFQYFDLDGHPRIKELKLGDGFAFRGTTTYHGVLPSDDPMMIRYMARWQFQIGTKVEFKSLTSEFRSKSIWYILYYLLVPSLKVLALMYRVRRIELNYPRSLICLTLLTILLLGPLKLPQHLHSSIGTGLISDWRTFLVLYLVCLSGTWNLGFALIMFNYYLLTDTFLPRTLVASQLNLINPF